jgi:hypothetical protein
MSIAIHKFTPDMLSSFTKIVIKPEDQTLGQALTINTTAVLQNMRAQIAEEKLHLTLDPAKVIDYAQQEAYLRGQLDILSHLINSSTEVQKMHTITDSSQL